MRKEKSTDSDNGKFWGLRVYTHDGYEETEDSPCKESIEEDIPFVFEHDM